MAGLTYTEFEPGADCYVVVYTPTLDRDGIEFLEGIVTEVGGLILSSEVASNHPLLRYSQDRSRPIRRIKTVVTDPLADRRNPIDPIRQHEEPFRDYFVVSPGECVRYLRSALEQSSHSIRNLEGLLRK